MDVMLVTRVSWRSSRAQVVSTLPDFERLALPARQRRARRVQPMQRDLAHDRFARVDVAAQQQVRLVDATAHHGAQDLRMLVVRGVDALGLGEVEPPDDAYA